MIYPHSGQAVAALSPSIQVAATINPFLLVVFGLFCGVTIVPPEMPKFWRSWMYQLDPFTRLISGLITTEMHGLNITCSKYLRRSYLSIVEKLTSMSHSASKEFRTFEPPSGQQCLDYAMNYINSTGDISQTPTPHRRATTAPMLLVTTSSHQLASTSGTDGGTSGFSLHSSVSTQLS